MCGKTKSGSNRVVYRISKAKLAPCIFMLICFIFHHCTSFATVEVGHNDFFTSVSNNHLLVLFITKMNFSL